ncbi:MAG: DEAD/DEAH box helicase family protein [Treponema sp.]|nr:DEAD/DEAH box helicase family protein [Treponema sp.]
MDIHNRFTSDVIVEMRRHIEAAGGNEVFFSGTINESGIVTEVSVGARGNEHEVPVNAFVARAGSVLIHNHPSGNLRPSDADLSVASRVSENAQGFYIINNAVDAVYVVMEPIKPSVTVPLSSEEASGYLSSTGPLAKMSPDYEERPVQQQLVKAVAECFNKNGVGVFEAGTGVGKSFAYLIPSMLWVSKNKERVVVSTGTINLQQQLLEKDIPAAEKIIGKKIKAVLVKGRQNYVCLRRLDEAGRERDLFSEETEVFDRIAAWVQETKTGDRSDLSFLPPDALWTRVNSEADACLGMRCPFREKCFVMRVRKEAADAQLLVVNHHLLFADIESRLGGAGYDDAAVLPPYRRIIFDEAHGIENAATSFFSESLNRFKIGKQLNLLYRQRRGSASGFLYTVAALAQEDYSAEIEAAVAEVKGALLSLEERGFEMVQNEGSLRLHEATAMRFGEVLHSLSYLQQQVAKVTGLMRDMMETIADEDRDVPVLYETKSVLRRLDDAVALCKQFLDWNEHPDSVFWVEKRRLSPSAAKNLDSPYYFQLYQTPLDIAPLMNEGVFEPMKSAVCTSATLGIGGTFNFWQRRTGVGFVERERILEGVFPSPFPYKTNLLLAVPRDAPFPDSREYQPYVEQAVVRLIETAGGRTLVLFTSYDSLRRACDAARNALRSSGITVLKQGEDDRFRLLSAFKNDRASVLFATDSFWEGVDVPGDSLSQVVIVKLPFGVPSDPVFAARSELVQARGGNPFMELSVPEAVIQFRQGFGRLIRRGDDRGAVVVLDRRIMEKPYGRIFLASIPECRRMYDTLPVICDSVEKMLN